MKWWRVIYKKTKFVITLYSLCTYNRWGLALPPKNPTKPKQHRSLTTQKVAKIQSTKSHTPLKRKSERRRIDWQLKSPEIGNSLTSSFFRERTNHSKTSLAVVRCAQPRHTNGRRQLSQELKPIFHSNLKRENKAFLHLNFL